MYIGATENFHKRMIVHYGYLRNKKHCNRLLQKEYDDFGKENLVCDIISEFENKNDCYRSEKYMTDCVLKMDSSICLNLISGGSDTINKASQAFSKKLKNDPEARRQFSIRNSRVNKGRKWSQEYKDKMSEATKGKVVSEETKQKIREAHKGEKGNNAKKVINTETGKVYGCLKDAVQDSGIKYDTLRAMVSGRNTNKTSFKWL